MGRTCCGGLVADGSLALVDPAPHSLGLLHVALVPTVAAARARLPPLVPAVGVVPLLLGGRGVAAETVTVAVAAELLRRRRAAGPTKACRGSKPQGHYMSATRKLRPYPPVHSHA